MTQTLPSLQIPTIPALFVQELINAARGPLDEEVHRLRQMFENRNKLSVAEYVELVGAIHKSCRCEMMGMLPGAVPLGSFEVLCGMLVNSPDVESALQHYGQFYALFTGENQPLISLEKSECHFSITVNPALAVSRGSYFSYSTLLGVVKLLSWLAGQRLSPDQLELGFPSIGMDSEFTYLFGTAPVYGEVSRADFATEVSRYPVSPVIPVEEYARQRTPYMLLWGMDDSFARQVYVLVAEQLEKGRLSVEVVADRLHMSRQTLARHLQSANTSYADILERARKDKALALLGKSNMPMAQIADSLGYSDTRSFNRAFKRWTGKSPGSYRR